MLLLLGILISVQFVLCVVLFVARYAVFTYFIQHFISFLKTFIETDSIIYRHLAQNAYER